MLLREFQPVNYELETNGEILWSNKHIFEDPIVIMNDSKSGKQSLKVKGGILRLQIQ